MPKQCQVCIHEQLPAIEAALVRGDSERRIASLFGVHHVAVHRHREHMSAALAALGEERVEALGDLFDRVASSLTRKLGSRFEEMDRDGQLKAALAVADRLTPALNVIGRASGKIAQQSVNVRIEAEIGVPVIVAREAVETIRRAEAMGDHERGNKMAEWLTAKGWKVEAPENWSSAQVVEGSQANGNGHSAAPGPGEPWRRSTVTDLPCQCAESLLDPK